MKGPLDGIRVVDLSAMIAGPLATMVLGEQGADVIKVEPPGTGDLLRRIGTSRGGMSAVFNTSNRYKRSLVLNLAEPRGRELLEQLVATADVFIQNFRPGVVERMGIGEPALRRVREDLIYVSISGFGESGPYAQRRVYDSVMQALSGLAALQGDPDTGEPVFVRNVVCDKATALTAAQAITAALFARERGAGGQHVRLAMLDASIAFLWPDGMQNHTYLDGGVTSSMSHAGIVSFRSTSDGYVTISVIQDEEYQNLCRALDLPQLASDPRFTEVRNRMRNARALGDILEAITRTKTTAELAAQLEACDVPFAPVNRVEALHRDPQVIENALLVESRHPSAGRMRAPRPVARFAKTIADPGRPAPALGEHTDEVLAGLGVAADETAQLRAKGVVA